MTIEELFGTLQQSVVATWRKHLRTYKYSKHMALNDFYEEMPEKVDALIEAWMGANGKKVNSFDNILPSRNMGTLKYLQELRKVVKQGYPLMNGEKELEALLDDIVELIDSTLYKVKELNEHNTMNDLKNFLLESLVVEAKDPGAALNDLYMNDGDLVSVASCFHWLDDLNWAKMSANEYVNAIHDINDSLDKPLIRQRYIKCMMAMQKMGKENAYNYIKDMVDDESELEDWDITL